MLAKHVHGTLVAQFFVGCGRIGENAFRERVVLHTGECRSIARNLDSTMTHRLQFNSEPREILPCDGSAVLHESFLEPTAADEILARLLGEVSWQHHSITLFGRVVPEPRMSSWIADVGVSYLYSGRRRQPAPWTDTLTYLRDKAGDLAGNRFNSVLANLYRSGNDSMGWHADDEPELGPEPVIASISLGAERRFDFRHNITGDRASTILPHGSLLVMSGESQHAWKHRMAKTARVHEPRINLTFRSVMIQ
jgi:alkylated DNA repair dioxygenase AlkB